MTMIETKTRMRSGALFAASLFALLAIAAAGPGLLGPGAASHDPLLETITITLDLDCVNGNDFFDVDTDTYWCGGDYTGTLGTELLIGPATYTASSGVASKSCAHRLAVQPEPTWWGDNTSHLRPDTFPWNNLPRPACEEAFPLSEYILFDNDGVYNHTLWVATNAGNTHTEYFNVGFDNLPPATPVEFTTCPDQYDVPLLNLTACSGAFSATVDVQKPFGDGEFGAPLAVDPITLDPLVRCRIQNVDVACGSSVSGLTHGLHFVRLQGEDVIGNIADRTHRVQVELFITVNPTGQCSILLSADGWCRTQVTLVPGASALSGLASTSCAISTFGDPPVSKPCGSIIDEDGFYTFTAQATSNVNRVGSGSTTFKIDGTKPDGLFTTPAAGCSYILGQEICTVDQVTPVAIGVVPVEFFADDPTVNGVKAGISHVEFRDNGYVIERIEAEDSDNGWYRFDWDTAEAPGSGTALHTTPRTLEARVHDLAGNVRIVSATVQAPPALGLP